jgi:hypothetical protein
MIFAVEGTGGLSGFGTRRVAYEGPGFLDVGYLEHEEHVVGLLDFAPEVSQVEPGITVRLGVGIEYALPFGTGRFSLELQERIYPLGAASQASVVWSTDLARPVQIFDFRDKCDDRRNKNPGAANANHAQPFGNVRVVVR